MSSATDQPADTTRIADALADLADTLTGFREVLDGQLAKDAAEQLETQERHRRRRPAEWEAALQELRKVVVDGLQRNLPQMPGGAVDGEVQRMADQVIAEIDRHAKDFYTLRYAFRALAEEPPEHRLEEEARAFVREHHGDEPAAVGEALVAAFMKGATRDV